MSTDEHFLVGIVISPCMLSISQKTQRENEKKRNADATVFNKRDASQPPLASPRRRDVLGACVSENASASCTGTVRDRIFMVCLQIGCLGYCRDDA